MAGILLDRQVSVWRKVLAPDGSFQDTQVYASIRCAIVPISKFDSTSPYVYESTHLVWAPYWLDLQKEDQLHYGRRLLDPQTNTVLPWIYVINGRRRFTIGIPQLSFYAREQD